MYRQSAADDPVPEIRERVVAHAAVDQHPAAQSPSPHQAAQFAGSPCIVLTALLYGLAASSALAMGAAIGALISALAFELVRRSVRAGRRRPLGTGPARRRRGVRRARHGPRPPRCRPV